MCMINLVILKYNERRHNKRIKKVYDPEMPSVDVFNLGLIYDIDIKEDNKSYNNSYIDYLCYIRTLQI